MFCCYAISSMQMCARGIMCSTDRSLVTHWDLVQWTALDRCREERLRHSYRYTKTGIHVATIYNMFKMILFSAHHTGTPRVVQYTGGVLNYCMHDGIPQARPVLLLHSFCLVAYIRIICMYLHIYICMYVFVINYCTFSVVLF